MFVILLLLALCLTGCVIGDSPVPTPETTDTVTQGSPPNTDREPVDVFHTTSVVDVPTFTPPPYVPIASLEDPARLPVYAPRSKPAKSLSPTQVITEAHQTARVSPSARCYHGRSNECAYVYQPGALYEIHLSPRTGTGIFLPPGERMVSALYLDPDLFDVTTKSAGEPGMEYDSITVHPKIDTGTFDTFILTESGRRYLLHLVVGKVAMLAVTFEVPAVMRPPSHQAFTLPLPRPPQ